jgi:phage terminase large subunit-like protein
MPGRKKRNHEFDTAAQANRLLKSRSPEEQRRIIREMPPRDALLFDADFEMWAHDGQRSPPGEGWRTWLMMAGRGFGKTRAGAEWIYRLATRKAGVRIALVGASIGESRSIMIEGVSGLISIARRHRRKIDWEPSLGRLRWGNGSQAHLFSGDHADGLRGPEFDFAWCDELAKWRQAQGAWDNLQMALRRGPRPRALVTTTPRPLRLLERIGDMPWTVTTRGKTSDNINLDDKTVEVLTATYGGTKLGRQELDGELLFDMDGALWPRELLARSRWAGPHPKFDRIMVGVDPPAGVGEGVDACGIVVAGSSGNQFYVLADESVQGLSPEGWASRVAAVAARWNTVQIVAEANNGGAMVKSVLHAADEGLKVRLVHASLGKSARAEPVALLFEKGRAHLAGEFASLEEELAGIIAGGGYEGPGRSPDRADAMVWALTALSETKSGIPRVRRL